MKILVTGDRGFVGEETKKYLEVRGHQIVGYDLMDCRDIRDSVLLEEVIKQNRVERILHLAAVARFSDADNDPQLAFEINALGTHHIVTMAMRHHLPLVYSSTGSVYMPIEETPPITEKFRARGNSVYGCTKYLGELYVRQHTPHIILRYAHLYGQEKRGHGLIGGFIERIQRGLAPVLYGGKQSNDFTYVKDVAVANCRAIEASWDRWNQIYNIGTGEEMTSEEAGKLICEISKYKGEIEKKEQRTVDPQRFVYDVSKAERMLGFKAHYKFRDGLMDMFGTLKKGG